MKAIAVIPGKPGSVHLAELPKPNINEIPDGRGVLVRVLRVGVDGTDKEIPWSGVYRISPGGEVVLLNKELKGPNGIAFSPDEKYLYVGNWDPGNKVVMRYEVMEDGTLSDGERFFDMTGAPGEDAIDGIKVDSRGNLYVSGPGGLWVISAGGKHIGTIIAPKHVHNMAWGGEDGKTLFLCARSGLYMMRLGIQGANAHYN